MIVAADLKVFVPKLRSFRARLDELTPAVAKSPSETASWLGFVAVPVDMKIARKRRAACFWLNIASPDSGLQEVPANDRLRYAPRAFCWSFSRCTFIIEFPTSFAGRSCLFTVFRWRRQESL